MKNIIHHRIIEAAERLFARFGVRKTGVDDIARAARVAKGTLYNYYGSKEGIIRELVREKLRRFDEGLDGLHRGLTDPVEKIRTVVHEHFRFLCGNPDMSGLALDEGPDESGLTGGMETREKSLIARLVSEARLADSIRDADPMDTATTLMYLVRGLERSLKQRIFTAPFESIKEEIDRALGLVLAGLRNNRTI